MTNFDANGMPDFLAAVREAADHGLTVAATALGGAMTRKLSGKSVSPPGHAPGVADGGLRRSIRVISPGKFHRRVGSGVFYGLVQETGNWGRPIRAVRKKYLTIPIDRYARRELRKVNFNIRSLNLVFIKRANKWPLLVKEQGVSGKRGWRMRPMFILKTSVKLPRRPWAAPTFVENRSRLVSLFLAETKADFIRRVVA